MIPYRHRLLSFAFCFCLIKFSSSPSSDVFNAETFACVPSEAIRWMKLAMIMVVDDETIVKLSPFSLRFIRGPSVDGKSTAESHFMHRLDLAFIYRLSRGPKTKSIFVFKRISSSLKNNYFRLRIRVEGGEEKVRNDKMSNT